MTKSGGGDALEEPSQSTLKIDSQPKRIAARGRHRISGEQSGEVNQVNAVVKILAVRLKRQLRPILLRDANARRSVDGKRGPHPATSEVDAIHQHLSVLGHGFLFCPGKLNRQTGAVLLVCCSAWLASRPRKRPPVTGKYADPTM